MGYRSEVAFCLQVKEPEKFIALMKVKADNVLREMLDNMYYVPNKDYPYILFTHSYWKWYEDSENAFNSLLHMAENYDADYACKFARTGENLDDIEEEAYGEAGWDLPTPFIARHVEIGIETERLQKIIKEEENATTS